MSKGGVVDSHLEATKLLLTKSKIPLPFTAI